MKNNRDRKYLSLIILFALSTFTGFAQVDVKWTKELPADILWQEVTALGNLIVSSDNQLVGVDTETGEVNTVRRRVEKLNVECVSGDRKIYQYMKKKYVNPNYIMDVNKFPDKSAIEELQNTIQSGMVEEDNKE